MKDSDPEYPALLMADFLVGGGMQSRLIERLRQKDGLSYFAGSQFGAGALDPSASFAGLAIFAPENLAKLEAGFREEMDRVVREGFSEEELQKGKEGMLQSRQLRRAEDRALASKLAQNAFLNRTLEWDAALEAKIRSLTPADVNGAVRRHIDPSQFLVVKAGDFKQAKPSQP
jgi:zinc protease